MVFTNLKIQVILTSCGVPIFLQNSIHVIYVATLMFCVTLQQLTLFRTWKALSSPASYAVCSCLVLIHIDWVPLAQVSHALQWWPTDLPDVFWRGKNMHSRSLWPPFAASAMPSPGFQTRSSPGKTVHAPQSIPAPAQHGNTGKTVHAPQSIPAPAQHGNTGKV